MTESFEYVPTNMMEMKSMNSHILFYFYILLTREQKTAGKPTIRVTIKVMNGMKLATNMLCYSSSSCNGVRLHEGLVFWNIMCVPLK